MYSLTDIGVTSEREREIADTSTHMGSGQIPMNPFCRPDKLHGIVVVFLHTRGNGKHVRVENNIKRIHANLIHQNMIGTLSYLDTSLIGGSLTDFVKTHHHDRSSISQHILRMGNEDFLALLQTDGVDDALALATFQTCRNDIPLGRVYHDRHLGDLRLSRYHIEEVDHLCLGIEQTIIHVDIDNSCPISYLFASDVQGFLVFFLINQSQELTTSSHIATLTDVDKARSVHRQLDRIIYLQDIKPRKPQYVRLRSHLMRLHTFRHLSIPSDEIGRSTTTAANDIDQPLVQELLDFRSHALCRLIILSHLVWQACVRMGADVPRGYRSHFPNERLHLRSAESTVHAHGKYRIRRKTGQESLYRLSAERPSRQVADRKAHHDWQIDPMFSHGGDCRINTSLGIERIEDGFQEDGINPTVDESIYLLTIITKKFIISNITCSRIAHVWTHRTSLVGRAYRANHISRLVIGRKLICLYASQSRTLVGHLTRRIF